MPQKPLLHKRRIRLFNLFLLHCTSHRPAFSMAAAQRASLPAQPTSTAPAVSVYDITIPDFIFAKDAEGTSYAHHPHFNAPRDTWHGTSEQSRGPGFGAGHSMSANQFGGHDPTLSALWIHAGPSHEPYPLSGPRPASQPHTIPFPHLPPPSKPSFVPAYRCWNLPMPSYFTTRQNYASGAFIRVKERSCAQGGQWDLMKSAPRGRRLLQDGDALPYDAPAPLQPSPPRPRTSQCQECLKWFARPSGLAVHSVSPVMPIKTVDLVRC